MASPFQTGVSWIIAGRSDPESALPGRIGRKAVPPQNSIIRLTLGCPLFGRFCPLFGRFCPPFGRFCPPFGLECLPFGGACPLFAVRVSSLRSVVRNFMATLCPDVLKLPLEGSSYSSTSAASRSGAEVGRGGQPAIQNEARALCAIALWNPSDLGLI